MSDLLMRTDPQFAPVINRAHSRRRRYLRRIARLVIRRLARLPARAWRAFSERRARRRLVAELRDLDDLLLADIGLHRGNIEPTVDELLRRRRLANDAALAVHAGKLYLSDLAWMRTPPAAQPVTRWPRNDNLLPRDIRPSRRNSR